MEGDLTLEHLLSMWDAAVVKPTPEELCRECPELLEPLRRQVKAMQEADRLLDTGLLVRDGRGADVEPRQVGRFRILGRIGEGGMGVVYRAEQREPVRRVVALKLIKLGMDSREVVARFEAERQALALMNHPNVAKVLEAGVTESGRPYFAMELVAGIDFVRYCEDGKLTVRQRIELFIPVCQAVQHAHQKGIIHRDLKPSNILVQLIDGKVVPKVIDFGIAKATNQVLTQHTLFTQTGAMIGTPEYMSPEQAMTSGLDVDTRTDIYSLGVILYQVLTGTLPLDPKALREAGLEGMARLIKNQEPARPSTRLLKAGKGSEAGAVTGLTRNTKLLHKELQEDLDWIVLKAMEKDRSRRYETANALAVDLQRHLDGETVLARPPSTLYRVQKFVSKHRRPVIAGTVIVHCLVFAIALLGWLLAAQREQAAQLRSSEKALRKEKEDKESANHKLSKQTEDTERANVELRKQTALANAARDEARAANQRAQADAEEARRNRDRAEENEKKADGSAREAKENLAKARMRLVDMHVAQADAWAVADRVEDARKQYRAAIQDSGGFGPASFSAEVGLDLMDQTSPPPILSLPVHGDTVFGVVFSADGQYVFSGSRDQTVRRWDLLGGRILVLKGKFDVRAVAGASDGEAAVAVDSTGAMWMCDLEKRSEDPPRWMPAGMQVAGLSANGKFALARRGGHFEVWDLRTGSRVGDVRREPGGATFMALSPDGRSVVLGTGRGLEFWKVGAAEPKVFPLESVNCVALSPDGEDAIVGLGEDGLEILNLKENSLVRSLQGHRGVVNCVAFSADGSMAISGSSDHTVRLWKEGREVCCFHGHREAVTAVAFSPDGRTAVSGGADGRVVVWPVPRRPEEFFETPEPVSNVALSADGRMALAGCNDGSAALWDAGSGRVLKRLGKPEGGGGRIEMVSLSGDGSRAVGAGLGTGLYVWDVSAKKGAPPRVLREESTEKTGEITSLAISADGRHVLCGHEGKVSLWTLDGGSATKIDIAGHEGDVMAVAFGGPHGEFAVSASSVLMRHDLAGGAAVSKKLTKPREFEGDGKEWVVRSVAVSPDGLKVVGGDESGRVWAWDLSGTAEPVELGRHGNQVRGVGFGPDGRTAFSGSQDRTLRMWDVAMRAEVRVVAEGIEAMTGIAVGANGMVLASSGTTTSESHRMRVWDWRRARRREWLGWGRDSALDAQVDEDCDAESLGALGNWYAFEEKYAWAVEALKRARAAGYEVDPEVLGRCYWGWSLEDQENRSARLERLREAKREFGLALERSGGGAKSIYLELCTAAVEEAMGESK